MKKIILALVFISTFYILSASTIAENIVIPDDAIRIRVVPHSNNPEDQNIKVKVKNKLEISMYSLLKEVDNPNQARKIIDSNLYQVNQDIDEIFKKENYHRSYKVNFGYNYFPQKEYKGVTYKEGYYESLLVTLGDGKGDNWWCVLFPPLCLIEGEENSKIEYKSLVKELLEKYLKHIN